MPREETRTVSIDDLPPTRPCTDPRHTGKLRARYGCVGPDPANPAPAEAAPERTPEENALAAALRAKVRDLEARRAAGLRALAYRQAAEEADAEGNRLYANEEQRAALGAWKVRDRLRARADEIQAAAAAPAEAPAAPGRLIPLDVPKCPDTCQCRRATDGTRP